MQNDEVKILTHLFRRGYWVDIAEIRKAWKFDDFDKAAKSLIAKEFITSMGASYRINGKGIKALKEG